MLLDDRRDAAERPRAPRRGQRTGVGVERQTTRWNRRALACCVLAALALAGALAHWLSASEQRRSGTNGIWVQATAEVAAGTAACQGREILPADTTAVRIAGTAGPRPLLVLRQGGRVLARVAARTDARRQIVEASVPRTVRDRTGVQLCLVPHAKAELFVGPTPPRDGSLSIGGSPTEYSMAVDYLRPGRESWWSFAPTVAARIAPGHHGIWGPWALVALVAASLALAARTLWRALVVERPGPRMALAVMAVAACNAAAWSFVTPPFQVPDEVAHVAYVQSVAETGAPPSDPHAITVSPEQQVAMADAGYGAVGATMLHASAWSRPQRERLAAELRLPLPRRPSVRVGDGEPEPPLYYVLESLPYRAASHGSLLDRIVLMRLLSAALGGVTALLCFLFVREALPGRPWAWAVGGLGVAFMPMLGFVSGGVNPDALLYALSAALFLCIARAWRRGVTLRLALGVGALVAAGMLTKVNFYGLVPGAFLGLALAARRTTLAWDRRLAGLVGAAVLVAGVLLALGVAVDTVVWHRPFAVGRPAAAESHVGLLSHLGYIWQVYLPPLPFMAPTRLTHPGYEQLFRSFVGVFGWMVVWLPSWVYRAATVTAVALVALALRAAVADLRVLRWRRRELLGYAAMAGVLMVLVGLSADLRRDILHIVQGRYMLPLLPLLGVLLALGARGAGERWGRALGVALVAAAMALTLLGQLTTIAFFYS
jgi:Predicted membrane protein (DUF2142)